MHSKFDGDDTKIEKMIVNSSNFYGIGKNEIEALFVHTNQFFPVWKLADDKLCVSFQLFAVNY